MAAPEADVGPHSMENRDSNTVKSRLILMGTTLVALTGNAAAGVMDSYNGVNVGAKLPEYDVELPGARPGGGRRAAKKMCMQISAQAGMTATV